VIVHAVHALVQVHLVFDAYERRVEEAWTRFEHVIDGAAVMGASVLVWHGLCREARGYSLTSPEVLEAIDRVAGMCKARSLRLGLENVSWCALAQVRDVLGMSARIPELPHGDAIAFTFDAFQAVEAGANPFMMLSAMEPRLANVHVRDFDESRPARRDMMPGEGTMPWPALIRAIASSGYAGPVMLEGALGDDPERAMAAVRAFLDPLIAEAIVPDSGCDAPLPPGLLQGIALFNAGEYYECHEVIEHEWHAERRDIRRLYQGILQIGVGLHHASGGNQRGAILLLGDGIEKVSDFLPACRGIDTAGLVVQSQVCLESVRMMGLDDLPAAFDWALAPRIEFV
jgi:sugar phosphate isomerase/epimerase/predicted metal-dependent hydrolase